MGCTPWGRNKSATTEQLTVCGRFTDDSAGRIKSHLIRAKKYPSRAHSSARSVNSRRYLSASPAPSPVLSACPCGGHCCPCVVNEHTEAAGQGRSRPTVCASWYLALLEEVPGLALGPFNSGSWARIWDNFPKDVCAGYSPDLVSAYLTPFLLCALGG